jgi:hypothetical protein
MTIPRKREIPADVRELRDPDRPFREAGDDLEVTTQRLDVAPERAHVHVRAALEL